MPESSAISKTEALSALDRARGRLKAITARTAEVGERTMGAGITVATSFGTGYAYGRGWGDKMIPGTQIPLLAAGGAAALILGVSGLGGKASDTLTHVGQGIVAGDLAIRGSMAGMRAKTDAANKAAEKAQAK